MRHWTSRPRRSGNRVLAGQRQLAAVFSRDPCLATGAPQQSRQQAAGVGHHQAVESGDQSPHSKRAMGAMRQKLCGIGRPARKIRLPPTILGCGIQQVRRKSRFSAKFIGVLRARRPRSLDLHVKMRQEIDRWTPFSGRDFECRERDVPPVYLFPIRLPGLGWQEVFHDPVFVARAFIACAACDIDHFPGWMPQHGTHQGIAGGRNRDFPRRCP